MDTSFSKFEKVNENMHIASKIKLRDSIHNIVMENLKPGEEMKLDELSVKLNEKFSIKISPEVLEKLLFIQWWRKDDYSIFREKDKKWLDVWPFRDTIERKKRIKDPPLGKSRRKAKKEEEEKERLAKSTTWNRNRTTYPATTYPKTTRYTGHKLNNNSDIDDEEDYMSRWGWW